MLLTEILLTDEEINEQLPNAFTAGGRRVAQAQLQKVVKWLDGECIEHVPLTAWTTRARHSCPQCLQALRQGAGKE